MKNPNSPLEKVKKKTYERWNKEDYPGGSPRFQLMLFVKDIGIFILMPFFAAFISLMLSGSRSSEKSKTKEDKESARIDSSRSQILEFQKNSKGSAFAASKKAPGILVKVRTLNVVETYSSTPVHVQIVDGGLGADFMGGTLVGDGTADSNFERINITFRSAREKWRENKAFPIAARALSMDGTLGLLATKKEGVFTRGVYGGAVGGVQEAKGAVDNIDLKSVVIRALSAGLLQEIGGGAQVEHNRSQVLRIPPGTEFFAELTDYFPTEAR